MAPKFPGTAKEMTTTADFSFSVISTVYRSTARRSAREANRDLARIERCPQRFREGTTSSDVIPLPLWNLIPCRSLKV